MPDAADLLATARLLLSAGAANPPSEAQLRRAVSTAYYAVFHKVVQAGAGRLMGSGSQGTAGYGLIYRSFNHGRMKSVCESLNVTRLSKTLQQQLGRTAVSPEMRSFAVAFTTLQEARHFADYDPSIRFILSDATGFVEEAEAAMATFDAITPGEKADILALMLANPRA